MPKSKVKRSRLFREVSFLDKKFVNKNFLKDLRSKRTMFCEDNEITFSHLEFLLWAYDKEFWTLNYAADEYGFNKNNMGDRIIYPLMKAGWCTSTSISLRLVIGTKIICSGKKPSTIIGCDTQSPKERGC